MDVGICGMDVVIFLSMCVCILAESLSFIRMANSSVSVGVIIQFPPCTMQYATFYYHGDVDRVRVKFMSNGVGRDLCAVAAVQKSLVHTHTLFPDSHTACIQSVSGINPVVPSDRPSRRPR